MDICRLTNLLNEYSFICDDNHNCNLMNFSVFLAFKNRKVCAGRSVCD